MTGPLPAVEVRPGDAPVTGPLAAAIAEPDCWHGTPGWQVLYADLDLAERAPTARTLGLAPEADDLALVRAALDRWGADAPCHLGGGFAVAAWDGDRVVAFRDAIGLRPLFVAQEGTRLVVGGDIRAVLAAGVSDALDPDLMVAALLDAGFRPVALGRTLLREVSEVRGGDRLVWAGRAWRTETWWDPLDVPAVPVRSVEEAGEALRAVLREVLAEAVLGGPVGVHVSSGIDSTAVAAFAAEALGTAPAAFSWQWPPGHVPAEEHARIASVAERWGLAVEWCPADVADWTASLVLDPTRDPARMWASEAPTRRAAHAAGVRVLLSGLGGDEGASFSGRGRIPAALARRGQFGPLVAAVAAAPRYAARRARQRWSFAGRGAARRPSLDDFRHAALAGQHPAFVRPDVLRTAALPDLPAPPRDPHAYLAWLWRRGHLSGRTGDWACAGAPFGLTYRYPLLDRRVLALVAGLPLDVWLVRRHRRRWPLRAATEGLLPDRVRLQGSKGEPAHAAASARVRRAAVAAVAPQLPSIDAGPVGALLDIAALADGVATWLAEPQGPSQAPRGLHALGYLPITPHIVR